MPLLALLAVFILVPLAELYVILKVGDAIGAVWTILLLAADSVLGSVLLRTQGRSVWRRFNAALAEGKMPHREVIDGVLVVFGGAFLITPGFITDIVGLVLLIPPARAARAVSAPALALSFFDPAREIYGTARSGTTIIFEGRRPVPHADGPALEQIGERWRAELAGVLELDLAPGADAAEPGGLSA